MFGEKFYLVLVISAFSAFGVTLAIVSWLSPGRFDRK
jgi:hypothetical protein